MRQRVVHPDVLRAFVYEQIGRNVYRKVRVEPEPEEPVEAPEPVELQEDGPTPKPRKTRQRKPLGRPAPRKRKG